MLLFLILTKHFDFVKRANISAIYLLPFWLDKKKENSRIIFRNDNPLFWLASYQSAGEQVATFAHLGRLFERWSAELEVKSSKPCHTTNYHLVSAICYVLIRATRSLSCYRTKAELSFSLSVILRSRVLRQPRGSNLTVRCKCSSNRASVNSCQTSLLPPFCSGEES